MAYLSICNVAFASYFNEFCKFEKSLMTSGKEFFPPNIIVFDLLTNNSLFPRKYEHFFKYVLKISGFKEYKIFNCQFPHTAPFHGRQPCFS